MVLGSVLAAVFKMLILHVSEINKNLKGMKFIRKSEAEKIMFVLGLLKCSFILK
jgi:hypothetical protein